MWFSFDYIHDSTDASLTEGIATYKHVEDLGSTGNAELRANWKYSRREKLSSHSPEVILRLDEGFSSRGNFRGGYIISDSELPGLEVSEDGLVLRFDWRGALKSLFREETLLRKHHEEMVRKFPSQTIYCCKE